MPVYFTQGQKPQNPVKQTNQCNDCEPTIATLSLNLVYDTERDAQVTVRAFGQNILNFATRNIWRQLWQAFRCTNIQCQSKAPCGARPTWIEMGAKQLRHPAGYIQWEVYVELAREIKCVAEAGIEDVTPEVPRLAPPESPQDDDDPMFKGSHLIVDQSSDRLSGRMFVWSSDEIELDSISAKQTKSGDD